MTNPKESMLTEMQQLRQRVDELTLTQEQLRTKLAEAERAAKLNLQLLRDARRERDALQSMARLQRRTNPTEGNVAMHSGSTLYWRTEKHGGRVYASDEIGGGVDVWDTALVSHSTLCEAIAVEFGLQAAEHREAFKAKADEHRAEQADAESIGKSISMEREHSDASAVEVPCPTCGALGCPTPCPNAEPV